ncbi:MAG: hypothetical protein IAE93_13385 [Ignavibacteria bacterium]|nr:hypothetical protein [Ignavibacteria bacterium]
MKALCINKRRNVFIALSALFTISLFIISWTFPNKPEKKDSDPLWLEQNWSEQVRNDWYFTSQGSQIFPYDWFGVLEKAGSTDLFTSDLVEEYGFLPGPVSAIMNPYNLPLGFTLDVGTEDLKDGFKSTRWFGFNCAACHTGGMKFKSPQSSETKFYILDGGQSHMDFYNFKKGLIDAITETIKDESKFSRFYEKVKSSPDVQMTRNEVMAQLQLNLDRLSSYFKSFESQHPSGPGRIDAFGGLFNISSSYMLKNPANFKPVTAPASIPFLWFLHRQSYTQWGGQTENRTEAEHLGRNMGEALGVFARINVDTPVVKGFPSTVRVQNLVALENWLASLESPKWPEDVLGKIDREASARGEVIFKETCAGCHTIVDKNKTDIALIKQHSLSVMGTDPEWNKQLARTAISGILQRQMAFGNSGPPLDSILSNVALLLNIVENVSINNGIMPGSGNDSAIIGINGYKAPILNGVWSTGPYLHNGSVPSLYEMLKAPEDRVKTFYVGSYEFDPVNVGFVTDSKGKNSLLFDTRLAGNSNSGHGFAAKLTEQQRKDLLEFLKTL